MTIGFNITWYYFVFIFFFCKRNKISFFKYFLHVAFCYENSIHFSSSSSFSIKRHIFPPTVSIISYPVGHVQPCEWQNGAISSIHQKYCKISVLVQRIGNNLHRLTFFFFACWYTAIVFPNWILRASVVAFIAITNPTITALAYAICAFRIFWALITKPGIGRYTGIIIEYIRIVLNGWCFHFFRWFSWTISFWITVWSSSIKSAWTQTLIAAHYIHTYAISTTYICIPCAFINVDTWLLWFVIVVSILALRWQGCWWFFSCWTGFTFRITIWSTSIESTATSTIVPSRPINALYFSITATYIRILCTFINIDTCLLWFVIVVSVAALRWRRWWRFFGGCFARRFLIARITISIETAQTMAFVASQFIGTFCIPIANIRICRTFIDVDTRYARFIVREAILAFALFEEFCFWKIQSTLRSTSSTIY